MDMRSRSALLAALAVLAFAAVPVACATAVNVEPGTGGQGGAGAGGGGDQGGGGGAQDAGSDAPPGPCVTADDCADLADICNVGNCVNGACVKAPANEFGSCNDGNFCTENDVCQAGECVGGSPKVCPNSSDSCHVGFCNEATDHCDIVPGNDGATCNDQDPCTGLGVCSGGDCLPGNPVDCSFYDGTCAIGVCDPQFGCVQQPMNDGAACDDGLYCTVNDTCTNGSCGGQPNTCAAPGDVCLIGTCDEASNSCVAVPGPNGIACNDNNLCTVNEACNNGVCTNGAPANQGGACNDGNACTGPDLCNNGVCAGAQIVACANGDGCCPAGCTLAQDDDCNAFSMPSYDASQTFQDALSSTTMTLAWDGTSFWSCSGGSPGGDRLARYSAAGALMQLYQPNIDFRSVFTKGDGTQPVYGREYSSTQVRVQTAPGSFGFDVSLAGGSIDAQSALVWDADSSQFVAFNAGTVTRWNSNGTFASTVTLQGFGNQGNENQYPQNRGIIYRGGYYVTYSEGTLYGWNPAGQRVKQTILNGAGTSFDSHFSLSYAAGKVWIVDSAGGTWRGYNVGL